MKSPGAGDYCLGVAGAGAMGQGIVQVAAAAGVRVLLMDAAEGAAEKAEKTVAGRFERLVEKERMTADEAQAAAGRIEVVDGPAGFAPCDAVVEAIIEDLEAKRALFREIEGAVTDDCLIASNTSSIPIARIARA